MHHRPHTAEQPFAKDAVLLKLYRQYGKDEGVKHLFEEIRKLKFRIGEMQSEIAELKDVDTLRKKELLVLKTECENYKAAAIPLIKTEVKTAREWQKDGYINELLMLNKAQRQETIKARKEMCEWRDKYFSLLARQNKELTTNAG